MGEYGWESMDDRAWMRSRNAAFVRFFSSFWGGAGGRVGSVCDDEMILGSCSSVDER